MRNYGMISIQKKRSKFKLHRFVHILPIDLYVDLYINWKRLKLQASLDQSIKYVFRYFAD
jgi:hypothetical protein